MSSFAVLPDLPQRKSFKNDYINKGLSELGLEGISVPSDMMDSLELLDAGKISREEFFAKEVEKAKKHSLEKTMRQSVSLKHAV